MSASDHLHKFKGVKRSGNGWVALCPAHDDSSLSLSIGEGRDRNLLLHCFAGCTFEAICGAAGIVRSNGGAQGERKIIATYDYRDESGILLYQVVRLSPHPLNPKPFQQRRPDGAGGWEYKLAGVRRVLYRLPELLASPTDVPMFIVEGEKDADRLASLGLAATTNAGGAGKWRDEYSDFLRHRPVVIIPDNDDPGREHAAKVARSISGAAASVRILELPGLPPKGDVSDWLDSGGLTEELLKLTDGAPLLSSETSTAIPETPSADAPLQIVRMVDVQPEQVRWLWYPYIALGKQTLVDGDPGIGKSTMLCAVASAVSKGCGLSGAEPFQPGNVLMLSAEDSLSDTLRPRLDAVGADVSRIFALNQPLTFDATGLVRLGAAIIEYAPVLVVIDPLFAFTGGTTDIHRANECRVISSSLAAIAERQGCAVVAVRHLAKSRGGGHALNAGLGSIDFTAAARSVLLVGADPDEPSRRAIIQIKNNLAPLGEAVGFTVENGQFYWTGTSTLTASRILSLPSDGDGRGAQAEAVEFLREVLANGARPAKEVKAEAMQAGLTEQNLRTARIRLGIKPFKEGGAFGGRGAKWMWKLPETQGVDGADVASQDVSNTAGQRLVPNDGNNTVYGNGLAQDVGPQPCQHLVAGATHDAWQALTDEQEMDGTFDECIRFFTEARHESTQHIPPEAFTVDGS